MTATAKQTNHKILVGELGTVTWRPAQPSSKPAVTMLNPSGIRPVEFKVVVYPKPVQEVTAGGIHLPPSKVTADDYAMDEGTIVAIADAALKDDFWGSNPPKIGDRVIFAKYAGRRQQGKDGQFYRIMNDKDIAAVLED